MNGYFEFIYKKIDKGNFTIRPLEIFKKWTFSNEDVPINGIKILKAKHWDAETIRTAAEPDFAKNLKGALSCLEYNKISNSKIKGDSLIVPISHASSSGYFNLIGFSPAGKKITEFAEFENFCFAHGMYYKFLKEPLFSHAETDNAFLRRNFHSEMIIINVAQSIFGEKINPGSVLIYDVDKQLKLKDDGKGNLIDYSYGNVVSMDDCVGFWNFDDKFLSLKEPRKKSEIAIDRSRTTNDLLAINCDWVPGRYGMAMKFKGTSDEPSFATARKVKECDFRLNDEFTISLWIKCPANQTDVRTMINTIVEINDGKKGYPFSLSVINQNDLNLNGCLLLRRWNTQKLISIITTTKINDGNWHHVAIRKRGKVDVDGNDSYIELYVDGVLQGSEQDYVLDMFKNSSNINFGASVRKDALRGGTSIYVSGMMLDGGELTEDSHNEAEILYGININDGDESNENIDEYIIGDLSYEFNVQEYESAMMDGSFFNGAIDEVRIYERALTTNEIQWLRNRPSNSNIVGNVFYSHGNIIITNVIDYPNLLEGQFFIEFESSWKIYRCEALCEIMPGEFTCTLNASLLKNAKTGELKDIFYHDEFAPYVTTIGLYNDNYELIAVAKLSHPIKKLENAPMSFLIKFDM